MSGNTTGTADVLIRADLWSQIMLSVLQDENYMSDGLYRDVTDFMDGDTLHIPVIGDGVLHDYEEDTPVKYNPLDTGEVVLTINQYKESGTYITDKFKQDSYLADALAAKIPITQARLIRDSHESDMLAQVNKQTLSNPNTINGASHRWVAGSGSTAGILTLEDLVYAKFVLDRANAPDEGRVLMLDPIAEASFNSAVAGQAFTNNPQFQGIAETGFAANSKFIRSIFGFDVYVAKRLPHVASETITGGPQAASTAVTDGVVNIFGVFGDDDTTPFMGAWRQAARIEGERNKDFQRDEFVTTARWGFGVQRFDTLGAILTKANAYK